MTGLCLCERLPKSPEFTGALAANTRLQDAKYFAKGNLVGPETVVFLNDTMYAGLANGQLVRIDESGQVFKVVQIGDETDEEKCSKRVELTCYLVLVNKDTNLSKTICMVAMVTGVDVRWAYDQKDDSSSTWLMRSTASSK